jgi:hypothetical protein
MSTELFDFSKVINDGLKVRGQRSKMNILEDYSKGISKEEIQVVVSDFENKLNSIDSVKGGV